MEAFEHCLTIWENDGPSQNIIEFIQMYNLTPPDYWNGARNLDVEIDINIDQAPRLSVGDYIDDDEEPPSISSVG